MQKGQGLEVVSAAGLQLVLLLLEPRNGLGQVLTFLVQELLVVIEHFQVLLEPFVLLLPIALNEEGDLRP